MMYYHKKNLKAKVMLLYLGGGGDFYFKSFSKNSGPSMTMT